MLPAPFKIRHCEPRDEAAVYEVCLRTGDNGNDATRFFDDPKALGHIFVGPYMKLEPELALVLEDLRGVCGYVLGALDSKKFYDAYLNQWLPGILSQHPEPAWAQRWCACSWRNWWLKVLPACILEWAQRTRAPIVFTKSSVFTNSRA